MNKSFTIDYPLQLHDLSVDARMRSWTVFNYLQDAAGRHADQLGLGLKQLRDSDLSWVLSRIRVRMKQFPEYGDTIRVTTWPSGFDRLFAYRQFRLSSADGTKEFGVAGSAWLTLNPANYRPVSPAKYLTGLPQWENDDEIFFQGETLGKLRAGENSFTGEEINHRISCAQIDYNRHLNNAYYAMFCEDYLGEACGKLVRMTEVQLNFNASTACRELLAVSGSTDDDGTFYIQGINSSGKNAFQAQGSFDVIELF